ncbi:hypothetical protein PM8797T_20004 [Gimesia maris DSM 8797]|nr:hypothetical protein PM8797T_20004 [Gimesia maris DSM 8797]
MKWILSSEIQRKETSLKIVSFFDNFQLVLLIRVRQNVLHNNYSQFTDSILKYL